MAAGRTATLAPLHRPEPCQVQRHRWRALPPGPECTLPAGPYHACLERPMLSRQRREQRLLLLLSGTLLPGTCLGCKLWPYLATQYLQILASCGQNWGILGQQPLTTDLPSSGPDFLESIPLDWHQRDASSLSEMRVWNGFLVCPRFQACSTLCLLTATVCLPGLRLCDGALQVQLAPPCGIQTTTSTPLATLLFMSGDQGAMYGMQLKDWGWPGTYPEYVSIEVRQPPRWRDAQMIRRCCVALCMQTETWSGTAPALYAWKPARLWCQSSVSECGQASCTWTLCWQQAQQALKAGLTAW